MALAAAWRKNVKSSLRIIVPVLALTPIALAVMPLQSQGKLRLPNPEYKYADSEIAYPRYFFDPNAQGSVAFADNTPTNNRISDSGATLGRVLFYDKRLSRNYTVACGSCHQQSHGFSDPKRFSQGLYGGLTTRHSMGITSSRFYPNGRFFWDERAPTLEAQVLQPMQNSVEMDMTLPEVVSRVSSAPYYPVLFQRAFGTPEVNEDRISKALAQFIRSIIAYRTKFDSAIDANGVPHFDTVFTQQEFLGMRLFQPVPGFPVIARGCDRCHVATSQISTQARNNGLDLSTPDGGRFKAPSLRNVAVRGPYMHDGRFSTLRQVVEFYNSGVQNNPNLDPILRDPNNGLPRRLNMTNAEMDALVAFLGTLTDNSLLTDPRFSDPFLPIKPITPRP
ncbi:MAG: hypothetical protein JSS66_17680 [Armatimonadetes bacterium]|nr:hypothetical protein [Armatimonadota bacterium]